MNIKVKNGVFNLTDKDVLLFNGACWQLITQEYFTGWHSACPRFPMVKCKKWVKKGALTLIKEKDLYKTADGQQMGLWYYKVNEEVLKEVEGCVE